MNTTQMINMLEEARQDILAVKRVLTDPTPQKYLVEQVCPICQKKVLDFEETDFLCTFNMCLGCDHVYGGI